MIDRQVGKYTIREQIGEGGMGVVYRAKHVMLGSPAAIKILLPQFTRDPSVVERFFTEAKATSAIRHPGIVQIFDYGRVEGDERAYIAMELLRGEDLTGFLARRRQLDAPLAAQITLQLLSALEAAHVRGVIHRDIKPDNIYLTRDPTAPGAIRVKVLDFGIAKLVPQGTVRKPRSTKEHAILGTPAYMAPEQHRSGAEIDARADLYAVGCILFEMLTGRPPFLAESALETMALHAHEMAPRVRVFVPSLPVELDNLLAKMLEKMPADRTPSAAWALAALERIELAEVTGEVPLMGPGAPSVPAATDNQRSSRFPLLVIAIALLVAAGVAATIGFL